MRQCIYIGAMACALLLASPAWAQQADPFEDDGFPEDTSPPGEDGAKEMAFDEDEVAPLPPADPPPAQEEVATPHTPGRFSLGVRLAGSYNLLSRPDDPKGEPTLLYGTAFSGAGFMGGAQGSFRAVRSSYIDVSLELGLLFMRLSGIGYAENLERTERQTITLTTTGLRVPLSVKLAAREGRARFFMTLGPELLLGLSSSAQVVNEGFDETPAPLQTTPVTHVGFGGGVGVAIHFKRFAIPIGVRGMFDPMVPASTRERFEGYESFENPGDYQVGFNTQVLVTLGFDYLL